MKTKIVPIPVVAAFVLFSAHAQGESLADGDIEAGKAKSTPCTACHGANGNSMSPLWPNLAGQSAPYIVAQLKAFRGDPDNPDVEPTRSDPLMSPQSINLSDEDINDLAVYYESLTPAVQAVADPALIDRAEAIWRGGNADRDVAACIACHGPAGRGNPAAAYPMLAGQHSAYSAKQLRDYAAGSRRSDGKTRMMRDVAERLSQDDIKALASYIQGLKQ